MGCKFHSFPSYCVGIAGRRITKRYDVEHDSALLLVEAQPANDVSCIPVSKRIRERGLGPEVAAGAAVRCRYDIDWRIPPGEIICRRPLSRPNQWTETDQLRRQLSKQEPRIFGLF